MLHALVRIIFEETGLRLTSVAMMSGTEVEPASFDNEYAQRMRMQFMVEVAEVGSLHLDDSPYGKDFGLGSQRLDVSSVPIALNLGKHRQHVWAREEDLKELMNSGLYPLGEGAQYRMMLEAFVFHTQNIAYFNSLI